MLSICVVTRDLQGAWRATPDGLANGRSYIRPYLHPALETVMVTDGDRVLCFVREKWARTAGPERAFNVSPGRLAQVPCTEFDRLAAALACWPLQWHSVIVHSACADLTADAPSIVTLESGHWGTAPVFLVATAGQLLGHWDASHLLPALRASNIDHVRAAHYLAYYANPYARTTLFHGLQLLTERARAIWAGRPGHEALSIDYPQPWPRPSAAVIREGADPVGALTAILDASLARWIEVPDSAVAVEVSGGLDSALVASRTAFASTRRLRSYGVALVDGAARGQDARRSEIMERFHLIDTAIPMAEFLPLAPGSCRLDRRAPSLPWEEGYYEVFDALLRRAAADGINVLLTGFGGDELCGLRPSELRAIRAASGLAPAVVEQDPAPVFLSPRAREMLDESLDLPPRAASSESSIECAALSAARYLRHGIWPVHSLCTPELVHFCARLPPHWRQRRRIERDALTHAGLSARVTHPSDVDNFVPAMVAALRGPAHKVVRGLLQAPLLHEMGIVDRDRLVSAFDRWCDAGRPDDAVHFLAAAVTELCLKGMA